jgi:chorismate dehydratase
MWVARDGVDLAEVAAMLEGARDRGVAAVDEIAAREAPLVGISRELSVQYLRENLHFTLGREERAGLQRFYELCVKHELAPAGLDRLLDGAGKIGAGWR